MRLTALLCCLCAALAHADGQARAVPDKSVIRAGRIQSSAVREASGLARSGIRAELLWVLNDSGSPAVLHAIGLDGSDLGRVRLPQIDNIDWEDLAAFSGHGRSWLLIADIGDNLALRSNVTLYVVEEPAPGAQQAKVAWQVSLRYPDGPRDAEAVAVDAKQGRAYILTKRTLPAELYAVPLWPDEHRDDALITADFLGPVASIPQPTREDLGRSLRDQDWYWQPTAMDFSTHTDRAVILTYRAAYLYHRRKNQSWLKALQQKPQVFSLGDIKEAEAVSLGENALFVTVEALHAPLYRININ